MQVLSIGLVNPFLRDLKSNPNHRRKKDLKSFENPNFLGDLKSNPKSFLLEICLKHTVILYIRINKIHSFSNIRKNFFIFKHSIMKFSKCKISVKNLRGFLKTSAIFCP